MFSIGELRPGRGGELRASSPGQAHVPEPRAVGGGGAAHLRGGDIAGVSEERLPTA